MSAARSEHEVSEIIDGLSEQEVRLFPSPPLYLPLCSSPGRPGGVAPGPTVKSDAKPHQLQGGQASLLAGGQ